jgi:hypothetical protein
MKAMSGSTTVAEVGDDGVALLTGFGLAQGEVSITGAATATLNRFHVCSGTAADYAVSLPTAVGNAGRFLGFRMSAALTRFVTLDGNAAETIDAQATRVMWAGESAVLLSDGANWFKVAGKTVPTLCVLRKAADQAVAGALGATVAVLLDTVDLDNTGRMADVANNRIVCRRPGSYLVVGGIKWTALPSNTSRVQTVILNNGAYLADGELSGLAGGYPVTLAAETAVALAAGDLVTLVCYHNNASGQTLYSTQRGIRLAVQEVPTW